MTKIFVTGNAGSGKSTTARKIANTFSIQYHSLDSIVWQEGWRKTPPIGQRLQIGKLIAQNNWVIDGVDYDVLGAADIVIFLDFSRRMCFWRAAKRSRPYLFRSRPELPAHCPEILIIPTLIKIIWRFPDRVRPKILNEKTNRTPANFIHIKNQTELDAYLSSMMAAWT